MTPPPPPSAIETTSASSTTVAAAAAAAPAEPPPPSMEDPHDECVLCCYPLPLKDNDSVYHECCGELICNGCVIAQKRTLIIGTNVKKPIGGSKEEELEFLTILASEQIMVCPFCRAKAPRSSKEHFKRLWERIDVHKDPKAMLLMGCFYLKGVYGLSKNLKRAEELYQQAYDLGDPTAANMLAELYINHIPDQQARIMKFLEEGVQRGNTHCNNRLGFLATKAGHHEEAKRFLIPAARSGHDEAMDNLMKCFRQGLLSKEDLATILRAHKAVRDNRKSEPREYARRHKAFKDKMIARGNLRRK